MNVAETLSDFKTLRKRWQGETIAFVPTMGALHEGHLSLIEKAKSLGSKVVVSIFVNPMQFGPKEDFSKYPRTREKDLVMCEASGVDAVLMPSSDDLYPHGLNFQTAVVPPGELVSQLCGLSRPGHFTGVATVVLKLLNIVQPDIAIFGEKDAQQLAVIKRMAADLNLPVSIVAAPTIREVDGLAKSSRNKYLVSSSDRQQARLLSRLLITIQELYHQGLETTDEAFALAQERVLDESLYPDFQLEYLAAVNNETFFPVEILDNQTCILIAARVGEVRLIDNTMLSEPLRLQPQTGLLQVL